MNQQELRTKIDRFKKMVADQAPQAKSDEQFQEFFAVGADILGELLIDINRIADAAELEKAGGVLTPEEARTTWAGSAPIPEMAQMKDYDPNA